MFRTARRGPGPALAVLLVLWLWAGGSRPPATADAGATASVGADALARLPLRFVPNAGQVAGPVRWVAHAAGGTLYFAPAALVLAVSPSECAAPEAERL